MIRWQEDEKHRNSQQAHGWTEECCRYLDNLTTMDISCTTPWHQKFWYESTITLVCNDDDRQTGPMRARKDFEPTANILTHLRQEQGRQNSLIPKNERIRQRPFDEALRADFEWMSQILKTCWSQQKNPVGNSFGPVSMSCGKGITTICLTIRSWMPGRRHKVGENAEETVFFSETHGVRGCVVRTADEDARRKGARKAPQWTNLRAHMSAEADMCMC